jgi:hypothetical protein
VEWRPTPAADRSNPRTDPQADDIAAQRGEHHTVSFSKGVIMSLAILVVVLESDLARKKIGWFRIARASIVAATIVSHRLHKPADLGQRAYAAGCRRAARHPALAERDLAGIRRRRL